MPQADTSTRPRNPWTWIPTLYFAEGLPYVAVMTLAVIMYKGLGISNTDIALYTGWLYLPWVIKPLWSPLVEILKTRRRWIWMMQLLIGGGMAGVALTLPASRPFQYSLAFFWLLAFGSATQDIAIDGFYLLATTEKEQAFFSGVRNLFYRLSTICGQGLLVILVGVIQSRTGLPKLELHAAARPGAPLVQSIDLPAPAAEPLPGELRFVINSDTVEISPQPRTEAEIHGFTDFARNHNVRLGFHRAEQPVINQTDSWWARVIAGPLQNFLRAHFGVSPRARGSLVGNLGFTTLHLSKPPGREVVASIASRVRLGTKPGDDGSFFVIEGARLAFNDQNWNQPALVMIQLDPRLAHTARGTIEVRSGNVSLAWSIAFALLAGMFLCGGIYHKLALPQPISDKPGDAGSLPNFFAEFLRTFAAFFRKKQIATLLLFMLLYRFAEAQLVKLAVPFLLDAREVGGLGLTAGQAGFVYGTVGIAALLCGGLLGGLVVSRQGLKFWLWWMVFALHLPDAVFVYLACALPDNFWVINLCVAVEQFGYGFGFTAYMLYLIYIARGEHQTAHYAICTGFMALGMMIPGMFSGWLQETIGYPHFFIWVLLATIPGFIVTALIPLEAEFGRKSPALNERQ